MNDALAPVITRYVTAVRSAADGQWRGRSATFWLSLGLDRGTDAHVALVRETFQQHGIAVSTSTGELGHEPPDAWIVLTATPSLPDRGTSIHDLPDSLFGDAPAVVDPQPNATVTDSDLSEPSPVAVSSPDAHSPTAGLRQPVMTPSARAAASAVETWGHGSSDSGAWVVCPSCGAIVLQTALFCPVCDQPQTDLREGLRQQTVSAGETPPALQKRIRSEGRPPHDAPRQRLTLPPGASVVIGILILGIGARLGDLLMPLLVLGAMTVVALSLWKPDILDTVVGRGTSRNRHRLADVSVIQIAVVVAVIVAMYVITSRTAMFSLSGGALVP